MVKKNYDNMLSCFHPTPEGYGWTNKQTDGRTDRIPISISHISILTWDKHRTNTTEYMTGYTPGTRNKVYYYTIVQWQLN